MIAGILVKAFLERSCHMVPQVAAGALRGIVRASSADGVEPVDHSLWSPHAHWSLSCAFFPKEVVTVTSASLARHDSFSR